MSLKRPAAGGESYKVGFFLVILQELFKEQTVSCDITSDTDNNFHWIVGDPESCK